MHGVYKYEHNGKVIYVGKTSSSFESRFYTHSKDEKFKPYLETATAFIYETKDGYEADFLETALINQHKPALNSAKSAVTNADIRVDVQWVKWENGWRQKRSSGEHRSIKSYSFTLREDTAEKLKVFAKENGVSASKMADHILSQVIK